MERELQFLGGFGIVRVAFNVLLGSSRSKLQWALTLTFILPLYFATLGQGDLLFDKIKNKFSGNEMEANERALRQLTWESPVFFVVPAAYMIFNFNFSLIWTAAAYTAASICTAKQVSYVKVISVWKRLTVTLLWFFVIVSAYTTAYTLTFFLLTYAAGFDNYMNSRGFLFYSIPMLAVFFTFLVYIIMVWYLASVISVLEEKYYGLAAMRKSRDLIKGKRITSLGLVILCFIAGRFIEWFFQLFRFSVTYGDLRGVGRMARTVYVILLLGLLCLVNLMWLLTQNVFYFVCKAYHHESVADQLFFLDPR